MYYAETIFKEKTNMSLKELISRDIETVFMNPEDFCDNLTVQIGTRRIPVIGSLQQNQVQNNSGNGNVLQKVSYTLYVKYPLAFLDGLDYSGIILSTGTHLTINDKAFVVTDISDEMGIATINLSSGAGR